MLPRPPNFRRLDLVTNALRALSITQRVPFATPLLQHFTYCDTACQLALLGAGRSEHDDRRVVPLRIGGRGRDRVLERPNGPGCGSVESVRDRSADAVESERLAVVPTALEHPVGEQQQTLAGLQTPPVGREPARRFAETKRCSV